jgi:hypothetical protein
MRPAVTSSCIEEACALLSDADLLLAAAALRLLATLVRAPPQAGGQAAAPAVATRALALTLALVRSPLLQVRGGW